MWTGIPSRVPFPPCTGWNILPDQYKWLEDLSVEVGPSDLPPEAFWSSESRNPPVQIPLLVVDRWFLMSYGV